MEFHPCHHSAFTLAGTVALPSPFPATGSVSIVLTRDGDDLEAFVKILQVVSDRRIITRFVRPADVRAIQVPEGGATSYGPECWPIRSIKKVQAELGAREKELRAKAEATGVLDEAPWYPAAIVHVAEWAPVLHRNEVGVTAAVSAEDIVYGEQPAICCHIASVSHRAAPSICCHVAHQHAGSERRSAWDRG